MEPAGVAQFQELIQRLIGLSVALSFIALMAMLFYAGFQYITSEGDPKKLQAAHQTVTWAVIGIFFLVLAWIILVLVRNFTGVEVTKFCIGFQPYCAITF